jgi:chromosome segregation ATPase
MHAASDDVGHLKCQVSSMTEQMSSLQENYDQKQLHIQRLEEKLNESERERADTTARMAQDLEVQTTAIQQEIAEKDRLIEHVREMCIEHCAQNDKLSATLVPPSF